MESTVQTASCYAPGVPREPKFDGDFSFNTGKKKFFTAFDYTLFGVSLLIPVLIGFYQFWRSRFHMELEDYILAKHNMSFAPVGISMISTFISAVTLLATPATVYLHNSLNAWSALAFIWVCPATAYIYVPVFYQLKVSSIYEYLELRFNRAVRTVAALLFILQMVLYISIVLYAPSIAFHDVSGLNLWAAMTAVGIVCMLYVSLGGIKAVLYTDCFQVIVMAVGVLIFLFQAAAVVGTKTMLESGVRTKRTLLFDFSLDPTVRNTVWNLFLGGGFSSLAMYSVNQAQVQRCLACRSVRDFQKAVWMSLPGYIFFWINSIIIGLYMSAFYENCDPLQTKLIQGPSELTILFMHDILGATGFQGLYLASVFGASLSSLSTGLNSIAMVVFEDFIRVFCEPKLLRNRERFVMQLLSLLFGMVCLQIAFLAKKFESILQGTGRIFGILCGPALGVFSLGMFFPWVNEKGALYGLCGSTAIGIFMDSLPKAPDKSNPIKCISNCNIHAFPNYSKNALMNSAENTLAQKDESSFYGVSYMWLSWVACFSCIFIGIAVSRITGDRDPSDVDPRLIVPILDVVFPFYYLPEETKKHFCFGIKHENFEGRQAADPSPTAFVKRESEDRRFSESISEPKSEHKSEPLSEAKTSVNNEHHGSFLETEL